MRTVLATGLVVAFLAFVPDSFGQKAPKVYGSSSPYKQEDYDRMLKMQFDTKSFEKFNHEYETKAIEMKAVALPEYQGNLKALPLSEWQSARPDFYAKSLTLREFEIRRALDLWSKPELYRTEAAVATPTSGADGKDTGLATKKVETQDLPPAEVLEGELLRQLINKGRVIPAIRVGDREIRGTEPVSGQSGTSSPRK